MKKRNLYDLFETKKNEKTYTEVRASDLKETMACAEARKLLRDDVRQGSYPEDKNCLKIMDEEFDNFLKGLGQ